MSSSWQRVRIRMMRHSVVDYQIPSLCALSTVSGGCACCCARRGSTPGQDRVFSSSIAYDFLMGNDLHPRLGSTFDLKIFHNSHVGMMVWSIYNLAYLFHQHANVPGGVSYGMYATNFLQLLYILDFFWMEDWYLKTIDIALDHFGWYLAWGITNWLPTTYTLQAHYLAKVTPQPALSQSLPWAVFGCVAGLIGYFSSAVSGCVVARLFLFYDLYAYLCVCVSVGTCANESRRHRAVRYRSGVPRRPIGGKYMTLTARSIRRCCSHRAWVIRCVVLCICLFVSVRFL